MKLIKIKKSQIIYCGVPSNQIQHHNEGQSIIKSEKLIKNKL